MRRFANPWPNSEPAALADLLRWARDRRRQALAPNPRPGSLPAATPALSYPRGGADACTATWIGHSTVLLQIGGLNVLTDPVFRPRASPVQWAGPLRLMPPALPLERLPPLDVVTVSHNHYDHLDKGSVRRLARAHPEAQWIAPAGLGALLRRWGALRVSELAWWDATTAQALRITATPARHFSARWFGDRNRSLWCGYAFQLGDFRAWFAGDTAYHPEFGAIGSRCGPFDLVMIPIGAYEPRWFMERVHVTPEEAVRIYQDIGGAPLMLAIHWGTFRLTDEPLEDPPLRTATEWGSQGLPEDRLWIASFGETRQLERPRRR